MRRFLLNQISSRDEILLVSSRDETHVWTEIFSYPAMTIRLGYM